MGFGPAKFCWAEDAVVAVKVAQNIMPDRHVSSDLQRLKYK